jgi:hypothetical protein
LSNILRQQLRISDGNSDLFEYPAISEHPAAKTDTAQAKPAARLPIRVSGHRMGPIFLMA